MKQHLKRCVSFLLVLILLFGTLPTAFAAEVSGDSTTATEETVSETTSEATASPAPEEAADVSQPSPDETGKTSPSTEETEPTTATDSTESTEPEPDSTETATDPEETTAPVEEETQPETIPEVLEEPDSLELLAEDGIMLASSTTGKRRCKPMHTFYHARDQPWFFVAPLHCFLSSFSLLTISFFMPLFI